MLRKSRIPFLIVALGLISVLISACGGSSTSSSTSTPGATTASGPACDSGTITFDGSTALFPLANGAANKYQDACSGATITAKQSGSGTGLSEAAGGTVDIGNSDIFADPAKYAGLTDHQVAAVVFSVVLNGHVTGVTNLTHQQISDIYTGKTTNWNQVGGPNLPIITVSRSTGSGTRVTFDQYVLNGGVLNGPVTEAGGSSNQVAAQSSDLATAVQNTAGAIGYVTTFYAKQNGLATVKIDGVSDDDANVENNTYKFWNIEHMYTKGTASGLAKDFIDYVGGDSSDLQNLRTANGFLPLSALSAAAKSGKQVSFSSTATPTSAPTPTATA